MGIAPPHLPLRWNSGMAKGNSTDSCAEAKYVDLCLPSLIGSKSVRFDVPCTRLGATELHVRQRLVMPALQVRP